MATAESLHNAPWPPPAALRRWMVAGLAGLGAHGLVLGLIAGRGPTLDAAVQPAEPPPVFIDMTPRRTLPSPQADASVQAPPNPASASVLPPVAVRPAIPTGPAPVAPLTVEPAPAPVRRPGLVIPRSWRERCGIAADAVITPEIYRACEQVFLTAAAPPPQRRSAPADPRDAWAREGARRIRNWEALNGPRSGGTGNARPSDQPGSNFGMGDIDHSVVPMVSTNGREVGWGDDD